MRTLTLAAIATVVATLASAPAFASSYGHSGHGHGHSSYGHKSYGHSSHGYGHRSHGYGYGHGSYAYQAPSYYKPAYVAPTYAAPVYVAPKPTLETRPVYVYQKVQGYCTDEVVKHGYGEKRRTLECKAGEAPKAVEPEPKVEEPPK